MLPDLTAAFGGTVSGYPAHVDFFSLIFSLVRGEFTPQELLHHPKVLPDDLRSRLVYSAVRTRASHAHPTLPEGENPVVKDIDRMLSSVQEASRRIRDLGYHCESDIASLQMLRRHGTRCVAMLPHEAVAWIAEILLVNDEDQTVLWYPRDNTALWVQQLRLDTEWWTRLCEMFPRATIPRNPMWISPLPHSPRTWYQFLRNHSRRRSAVYPTHQSDVDHLDLALAL